MDQTKHRFTPSVLVVDDEPEASRRDLEEAGFTVKTAESVKAARSLIERERPQVVFTDVSLRDDILPLVKATHPDALVVVIAGAEELSEARDAVRQGAFHFIVKPWAADDLVTICRRAIETFTLKVENARLKEAAAAATLGISEKLHYSRRPERAAIERAAFVRVTQYMGDAITKAPTPVLEKALGELQSEQVVTDVLGAAFVRDATEGEWAAALLRGAQVQRDLLQKAGGGLSATKVGSLLGISRAAVDKRRRQGALLGLKLPSGDFAYPAAQFARNDVLPGLPHVLGAFRVRDPWMQLDVLLARDEALGGRTAFEALAEGNMERVKVIVSSFGEQGL